LPSSHDLLLNPPGKLSWKNTVYRAVNQYWESKLKEEAYTKRDSVRDRGTMASHTAQEFQIPVLTNYATS
jgi:hypothetical protein